MGNLYYSLGLYSQGIENLEKALQVTPDDEYARMRMGDATTNLRSAIDVVDKIITSVRNEINNLDLSLDSKQPGIDQKEEK